MKKDNKPKYEIKGFIYADVFGKLKQDLGFYQGFSLGIILMLIIIQGINLWSLIFK